MAWAQDLPDRCLPGPNPSGHPLFGAPTARVDVERVGGASSFARATHAAFGDLNGDGLPDAAVTSTRQISGLSPAYVTVCFNQGSGVFGPPMVYAAGRECCALELGDFDRDGDLDLVVVNALDNTVSLLRNHGNGTFGAPANYPVGVQPRSLKVGDLNGDGWPDLAVLNCVSNDLSILLNNAAGTFGPQARVAVPGVTQRGDPNLAFPYPGPFLALGDFNGDLALDIAVPARTRVRVLLNNGAGGFAAVPVSPLVTAPDAYCIATGDLDCDGRLDMAVAVTASGDHGLNVLRGRGDGTFDPAVPYNADTRPLFTFCNHVTLGDIDSDGFLDAVVGAEFCHGSVPIFRNRRDGTFFPKELMSSDYRSWYVGLVDLAGRGVRDLAVLSPMSRSPLKVHLNGGGGTLLSYERSDVGVAMGAPPDSHERTAAADIDRDGNLDLAITVTNRPYQVKLCRGLGGGRFGLVSTISLGSETESSGEGVSLADLNGDLRPDLVVADPIDPGGFNRPGKIWVVLNTGGIGFGTPVPYALSGVTPMNVVAVDLNGDGQRDLAAWSTEVYPGNITTPIERRAQVLLNRGDGSFEPPTAYALGAAPARTWGTVAAADFDRDGDPDLVGGVAAPGWPGSVTILRNRGDGTFDTWSTIPVSPRPNQIIGADFNGDGFADIAIAHIVDFVSQPPITQFLTVLYNDGTGSFPTRSEHDDPQVITGNTMATGDFNADGRLDLALDDGGTRGPLVLLNRGDGRFNPPFGYGALGFHSAAWVADLATGDFDRSGRTGILALNSSDHVSYLHGVSCPSCYANCDRSVTMPILNAADFACFMNRFAVGDPATNCDSSLTTYGAPALDVADFVCFMQRFAAGCP